MPTAEHLEVFVTEHNPTPTVPCSECNDLVDPEELIEGCCTTCAHTIAYMNAN